MENDQVQGLKTHTEVAESVGKKWYSSKHGQGSDDLSKVKLDLGKWA